MSDKPILFSGPMVRALIAGTKTQTRRYLTAWTDEPPAYADAGLVIALDENEREYRWSRTHAVGDRLYVREHWRVAPLHDDVRAGEVQWHVPVHYVADGGKTSFLPILNAMGGRFRQGMHMPRWASRLTLTVTDVRVERLQDISEPDALAEGMSQATADAIMGPEELAIYASTQIVAPDERGRILYERIWYHINGQGSWEANPWVAAYTFTVAMGNIDDLARAA